MPLKDLNVRTILRASEEDDTATLLSDVEEARENRLPVCQTWTARIFKIRWFVVTLVVSNLATLIGTKSSIQNIARNHYSQDFCDQVDVAYGGDIDRELTLRRFPKFNFNSNAYTGPPSESVDQAWDDLGIMLPYFILPKHLGPTFGLNNSHFWLDAQSLGTEGYPVVPEMIHHLHCLDSLRKNLYYNHEYYAEQRVRAGKEVAEQFMRSHINHCVDALRERLLCTADIGVVPFLWRNAQGDVMPDFGREHKCHDHKSVISWYEQHSIPLNQSDIRRVPPPEAIFHPVEDFLR